MLAAGLAGRGIGVTVLGPSSAEAAFGFGAIDGVTFLPVEFGDRPQARDVATLLRLRRLLSSAVRQTSRPAGQISSPGGQIGSPPGQTDRPDQAERPDVVHAHGLRAGALTVLALVGMSGRSRLGRNRLGRERPGRNWLGRERPGRNWLGRERLGRERTGRRPALVVTVHNAPPPGCDASVLIYRALERVVARGADLVLCVSADLEARMRSAGARRTGRAIVPSPSPETSPAADQESATGRPMVLAVGRLAAQKGFDVLLDAAARWQDLDPVPLLAIAGDGPLAGELRARAASLGVQVSFLGHRDDVAELLAGAAVFVLPSRWEGQPLILQEALRVGAPIVATRVGGIPDVVGDAAAVLVGPGDAPGLAAAVRAVLTDASLASRLRAAASRRGAALPTADDAIAAVLAAYDRALKLT
jgi:glycosyltransferase involved in cell wall biosynthesis